MIHHLNRYGARRYNPKESRKVVKLLNDSINSVVRADHALEMAEEEALDRSTRAMFDEFRSILEQTASKMQDSLEELIRGDEYPA